MNRQTHIVHKAYESGSAYWITIKGHARPYHTDDHLNEGDAVVIDGTKAIRPHQGTPK